MSRRTRTPDELERIGEYAWGRYRDALPIEDCARADSFCILCLNAWVQVEWLIRPEQWDDAEPAFVGDGTPPF